MPGFLSPGKGVLLPLIPEYLGINKGQRVPDRSKTAHRKPLVKCFLIFLDTSETSPDKGRCVLILTSVTPHTLHWVIIDC